MGIEVQEISKVYDGQEALKKVSFHIGNGEIVGFLGPNGAGKSTLMKILTGYITASQGSAKIEGLDVVDHKIDIQKKVGYLPEHNPLYLEMFVREYLNFSAKIHRTPKEEIEKVIKITGLTPEVNKKIGSLSKGYRQRVGLANALLHNPEVLILDEPTTGLDPNQLIEIRELIKSIGKEKTIFLSTHIMQEVEAICDRVIIIKKGEIVADKKLKDLKNSNEQIIEVEFNDRIDEAAFKNISSLEKIVPKADFTYWLYFQTEEDMRPVIFDFAQANGLKILQLHQKHSNLEDLFIQLTAD
ncbi:gliding motility-associated ABC transporter ATP-binding subunit GldA [Mesonia sp. MT50]|uniref:Gliding motility-associated ABC transporter ATP-binding subunit GldA n=1 Tax=Mesonia profundi TaxID=3070998 RepID=A0ABU1A471_9FLAO|nr:gliding motility-associated ABC transporter ATP-binding subunit GldA [Mesonia profundi]MDQ7918517.1 gliding motility-associated ABC transporter ATP-binding subunit GldA [Mesonia profundi]